jgi:hypothetical protein
MVESQPSKLLVASSILVSRSMFSTTCKTLSFTLVLRLLRFLSGPFQTANFRKLQPLKIGA